MSRHVYPEDAVLPVLQKLMREGTITREEAHIYYAHSFRDDLLAGLRNMHGIDAIDQTVNKIHSLVEERLKKPRKKRTVTKKKKENDGAAKKRERGWASAQT